MPASGNTSSLRSEKYLNSRAGSLPFSSMRGLAAAKSAIGWRFTPACCAAQSVRLARRGSAVLKSAPAWCPQATQLPGQVCWSSASRRMRNAVPRFGCCTGCFSTRARSASPLRQRTTNSCQLRLSHKKPGCTAHGRRVQWLSNSAVANRGSAG